MEKENKDVKNEEVSKDKTGLFNKFLNFIEKTGNKLPDPAMLFFLLLVFVWIMSAILAP
ncbi:MAG TPA: aminobenzoyl-glutamate transporter, partial [Balneolaceae bacterium]|nr:aminobenzoyl-glutamate transporter [Balneolaceae bacterium]